MGRPLFLSKRHDQRLHDGSEEFSARPFAIREDGRGHFGGKRRQSGFAQRVLCKEGLTFKLLADPGGKVSAQYGSTMDYKGTTMAARNTFLINPEGKIAKVYTGVKPAEHSEQVLKDLAELKKS